VVASGFVSCPLRPRRFMRPAQVRAPPLAGVFLAGGPPGRSPVAGWRGTGWRSAVVVGVLRRIDACVRLLPVATLQSHVATSVGRRRLASLPASVVATGVGRRYRRRASLPVLYIAAGVDRCCRRRPLLPVSGRFSVFSRPMRPRRFMRPVPTGAPRLRGLPRGGGPPGRSPVAGRRGTGQQAQA
jgi:hypothetical protein